MNTKIILITMAAALQAAFSNAQDRGGDPSGPPPAGGRNGGPSKEQGAPPRPPGPPPIIAALDTDDDGIISAKEIAAAPDSLKKLDKNGDGELTPDEYLGPPPNGGRKPHDAGGNPQHADKPPGDRPAPQTDGTANAGGGRQGGDGGPAQGGDRRHGPPPLQIIGALDTNGDGTISADEIKNAPSSLLKLDKNGDGQLGPREYGPKPPPLPPELQAYDKNGNGKLDPDEKAAVDADIQSGKLQPPPPPARGGGDGDGPAPR